MTNGSSQQGVAAVKGSNNGKTLGPGRNVGGTVAYRKRGGPPAKKDDAVTILGQLVELLRVCRD